MVTAENDRQAQCLGLLLEVLQRIEGFGLYDPIFSCVGQQPWSKRLSDDAWQISVRSLELENEIYAAVCDVVQSGLDVPDNWLLLSAPRVLIDDGVSDADLIEVKIAAPPSAEGVIRDIRAALTRWQFRPPAADDTVGDMSPKKRPAAKRGRKSNPERDAEIVAALRAGKSREEVAREFGYQTTSALSHIERRHRESSE